MKRLISILSGLTVSILFGTAALGHGYEQGAITITHPWMMETSKDQKNAGIFMTIHNSAAEDDFLISAECVYAEVTELHAHKEENGVMKMMQIKDGIKIAAGKEMFFKPHSYHVMLFNLKGPVQAGESIPVKLVFKKAGSVTVEAVAETRARGAELNQKPIRHHTH